MADTNRVSMTVRISRFDLPPVESALIVGKKAPIGSRAMLKALEEMLPGAFTRIEVEHESVEALLIRRSHLRRVPEEQLVPYLLAQATHFLDESEMLRVELSIEVLLTAEFDR